ncbi:MAG: hypothetical protein ACSW8B_00045, partial [bacterium]
VGRTFLEQCPELKGYINYFGYALYNRYINVDESKISENESLFYDILEEIAGICKQERFSPLEATINRAIKHVTKAETVDYKKLSQLLDYLDAPTLDDKPFVNKENKEFESKKEKWYRMKVRALYEIGDYNGCYEQANIALGLPLKWHYNNLNWVKYYRGCALVELGKYEEAEQEFLSLKGRFNAIDFTTVLYKLYANTNRKNEANTLLIYDFFLDGFDYRNIEKYKAIIDMAQKADQPKAASLGAALVAKLESEHGNTYETDIEYGDYADLDASRLFDKLYDEVIYHLQNYIDREEGKVVYYNSDKEFGSILQHDADNLFFRQADFIEDEEVRKFDVVEFSRIKTFDRKRQTPSSKVVLLKTLYEDINY